MPPAIAVTSCNFRAGQVQQSSIPRRTYKVMIPQYSGHKKSRITRSMTSMHKQTALPTVWESNWNCTQQRRVGFGLGFGVWGFGLTRCSVGILGFGVWVWVWAGFGVWFRARLRARALGGLERSSRPGRADWRGEEEERRVGPQRGQRSGGRSVEGRLGGSLRMGKASFGEERLGV